VLPAIAKVIEIFQGLCADIIEHVNEAGLAGIERPAAPIGIRHSPSGVFGANLIEVAVGPSELTEHFDIHPSQRSLVAKPMLKDAPGRRGGDHLGVMPREIARFPKQVLEIVWYEPICRLPMRTPGVGP
jgi:hypothetical protein